MPIFVEQKDTFNSAKSVDVHLFPDPSAVDVHLIPEPYMLLLQFLQARRYIVLM